MLAANTDLVPKYWTADELAEMLRVKRDTVDQWRFRGQGPRFIRFGKKSIRYSHQDVMDWIKKREAEG